MTIRNKTGFLLLCTIALITTGVAVAYFCQMFFFFGFFNPVIFVGTAPLLFSTRFAEFEKTKPAVIWLLLSIALTAVVSIILFF